MTTPYTCKLSPTEYKEAFEKARKNEAIIKNKLEKKHPSLTIIIPERQEDVNSREEADDYIDEGDLYIDFNKGKKPKLTEIKCLSYQWTCREDFPFQRSLIVNSVEGINKKIKQGFGIPDFIPLRHRNSQLPLGLILTLHLFLQKNRMYFSLFFSNYMNKEIINLCCF